MLDVKTVEECVSHWAETVRMVKARGIVGETEEERFEKELDQEYWRLKTIMNTEASPLDDGYYVFSILRCGTIVYIGTARGMGEDKKAIVSMQQKYHGNASLLLSYGLRKDQARYLKRKLKKVILASQASLQNCS